MSAWPVKMVDRADWRLRPRRRVPSKLASVVSPASDIARPVDSSTIVHSPFARSWVIASLRSSLSVITSPAAHLEPDHGLCRFLYSDSAALPLPLYLRRPARAA